MVSNSNNILYKKLLRNNRSPMKLGSVFIMEDEKEYDLKNGESYLTDRFGHNNTVWYLPFDICTLLIGSAAITIEDNPIHFIDQLRRFSWNLNNQAVVTGYFRIDPVDTESEVDLRGPGVERDELGCVASFVAKSRDYEGNWVGNTVVFIKKVYLGKIDGTENFAREFNMNDKMGVEDEFTNEVIGGIIGTVEYFTRLIGNTRNFVVEERVAKKNKKGKIISRSGKPLFRIISSKILRKNYIPKEQGDSKSQAGHERRRHERTYRDDRYVNMKGKTQIIEATWIGPTETYKDNRLYIVRLDIG